MDSAAFLPLTQHFAALDDPRVERTKLHRLLDIVVIALCAVIAGAESWDDIALFGQTKADWLRQFLALPNGIPSHDTFNRVFAALDPEQFRAGFQSWIQAIAEVVPTQVIAVDGKTVRGSHDRHLGKSAIHMVSAWATQSQLVLAQVKVDDKSNEITAIPDLLRTLELSGCLVTIDAMGCQRAIAEQLTAQGAAYVLALKDNQPDLLDDVVDCLTLADAEPYDGVHHDQHTSVTKAHGRLELHHHTVLADPAHLTWLQAEQQWPGLQALGRVLVERRALNPTQPLTRPSTEVRYYLLSQVMRAEAFGAAVRSHWGIENQVHWVLDVTFHEDASRIRAGHAAENVAVLRHIALNLLRQTTTPTTTTTTPSRSPRSLKAKRLKAAWDTDYLLQILAAS
jgi:predicted transposase YbfD/YdcC